MTFDSDHILLALNGIAYLALFFSYMYAAAKHSPTIFGAHIAGYTSILFAIMFFLRALDVLEPDDFTWVWRLGVFTFVFGNMWALRELVRPSMMIEVESGESGG
jgi:hypothetical protein